MPTTLTTKANEEGTYIITAAFTDEDGNAVSPNTLTWTLTDRYGAVINNRLDVVVTTPSSSEDIVLSGDDLAVTDTDYLRVLLVEGTYDSAAGSDLPLTDECRFTITNFAGVS